MDWKSFGSHILDFFVCNGNDISIMHTSKKSIKNQPVGAVSKSFNYDLECIFY